MDVGTAGSLYAGRHVHLIGIAGSGMRALAVMLLQRGAIVSGSDRSASEDLDAIAALGAAVVVGQSGENISSDIDLVVFSAAIAEANPERMAAEQAGIETIRYAEMLGRLMSEAQGIAVAGTHGKSTTSAMIAYALTRAGRDPSYVVGADVPQLGGPSGVGQGPDFVAEACEFDRSFLHLAPACATILNLEEDHLDCYENLEGIIEAFRAFVSRVAPDGVVIVNGEDRNAMEAVEEANCRVESFGFEQGLVWQAELVGMDRGMVTMAVRYNGEPFCELTAPLVGMHNAYNTLAAIGVLHNAGLSGEEVVAGLAGFAGTDRRMTLKGQVDGVTVIDDYAHHPTEIQATLRAIHNHYQPERLICVFQPHQHSRTRFMLKDFANSFGRADEVIVPDIYFVRDSEQEKEHISSQDLVAQIRLYGGIAIYLKTFGQIVDYIKGIRRPGDVIVTMGAGTIWDVADRLV